MSAHQPLHAALIGAGPLGINIYRHALKRPDITISQVVDIDPSLKGKDMGEHAGLEATGVYISDSLEQ